ncbi:MAG: hypothetical protein KDB80_16875 [Planctomycetes bacterium]|nr:hypothetical protein [Planctomycetota bacterium]
MRNAIAQGCLVAAFAALAPDANAQFDLTLSGGSVPGTVEMAAGPFVPDGRWGVVLISVQQAAFPLSPLDPTDMRVIGVGFELGSISRLGLVNDGSGVFHGNPMTIPNQANFIDGTLYFQGLYVPGNQRFFGPLSPVGAIHFGPANSFHSRGGLMSVPRSFFPSVTLDDGRVMFPGGGSGALLAQLATNRADLYDPVSDTFNVNPLFMRSARSVHTATTLFDGRVLIVGGVDTGNDPSDTSEWYDPFQDSFINGPLMSTPRMGHTATSLPNGKVLVTGGMSDLNQLVTPLDPVFSTVDTTELFNPFTNLWEPGPTMSVPRAGHSAIELPDGRILLVGGVSYYFFQPNVPIPQIETTTDIYDPASNTIMPGPPMSVGRGLFSVSDLGGGEFLVAGGLSNIVLLPSPDVLPTNSCEIFDSNTDTWRPAASMAVDRAFAAVYPIGNGQFMHFGGGENSALFPVPLDTTEIYDAAMDSWSFGPTMPQPLAAFGSYASATGPVHILGGSSTGIPGVVADAYWYYP